MLLLYCDALRMPRLVCVNKRHSYDEGKYSREGDEEESCKEVERKSGYCSHAWGRLYLFIERCNNRLGLADRVNVHFH